MHGEVGSQSRVGAAVNYLPLAFRPSLPQS